MSSRHIGYKDAFYSYKIKMLHAQLLQSCPTLCDPTACSPPGSAGPWDSPDVNIGVGCHFLLH